MLTPAYGGWGDAVVNGNITIISAIGTDYSIAVANTIVEMTNTLNMEVVAGGGLRNLLGETATFEVFYFNAGGALASNDAYDAGFHVRQSDDATFDPMLFAVNVYLYTGANPTDPSWSREITLRANETVFSCVNQTSAGASNCLFRGNNMYARRIG